jgi:5-methylcytosine-specific restriction endonuclease McrA
MGNIKYKIIDGKKECGQCGIIKPIEEFYKHKNYYRSYCKVCQNANTILFRKNPKNKEKIKSYSKKQYNKDGVKEKKFAQNKQWLLRNKLKAIEYKGGKCEMCGYDKCPSALEFHHKNPLEKEYHKDSRGLNRRRSFENSKEELDKCILLCANCHREIHFNMNNNE